MGIGEGDIGLGGFCSDVLPTGMFRWIDLMCSLVLWYCLPWASVT